MEPNISARYNRTKQPYSQRPRYAQHECGKHKISRRNQPKCVGCQTLVGHSSSLQQEQVSEGDIVSYETDHFAWTACPMAHLYAALETEDSIRLLKIEPDKADSALRTEFVISGLGECPTYTALSYTWAEQNEVAPLIVNNKATLIWRPLVQVLRAIRASDRPNYCWIDAICIDQNNGMERTSQMKKLAEIYNCAQATFMLLQDDHWKMDWRLLDVDCVNRPKKSVGFTSLMLQHNVPTNWLEMSPDKSYCTPRDSGSLRIASFNQGLGRNLIYDEFVECRSLLHNLFATCNSDDFPTLSIVLSATQTSFRALHLVELARITALLTPTGMSLRDTSDFAQSLAIRGFYQDTKIRYLEDMLQNQWGEILYLDTQNYVRFTHTSMHIFLSRVPIRGVDTKHETMANACLKELQCNNILVFESDIDSYANAWRALDVVSDLVSYAADFWHGHFKLAQHVNPALSERLHEILWPRIRLSCHPELISEEGPGRTCSLQCNDCVELASAYCVRHGFTVLGDVYVRIRAGLRAKLHDSIVIQDPRCLEDGGQVLGDALTQCRIRTGTEGVDSWPSSPGELSSTVEHVDEWDSDSASMNITDAYWQLIDRPD